MHKHGRSKSTAAHACRAEWISSPSPCNHLTFPMLSSQKPLTDKYRQQNWDQRNVSFQIMHKRLQGAGGVGSNDECSLSMWVLVVLLAMRFNRTISGFHLYFMTTHYEGTGMKINPQVSLLALFQSTSVSAFQCRLESACHGLCGNFKSPATPLDTPE